MTDARSLVAVYGPDQAIDHAANAQQRTVIRIISEMLENPGDDAFVYAGFALTSLPHRSVPADTRWIRENGPCKIVIEPGPNPLRPDFSELIGIPYGALARCILIYLQTEAVRNRSREVELGPSLNAWANRLGIANGGTVYTRFYNQLQRIQASRLHFHWSSPDGSQIAWDRDSIIKSGFVMTNRRDDGAQHRLWRDVVTLGETFYEQLARHPVLMTESAIRALKANSQAIDIYIWLVYRLPHLKRETFVTWSALKGQFGEHYARIRKFREVFSGNLELALAAYPGGRVKLDERGATLYPSPSPTEARMFAIAAPAASSARQRSRKTET